MNPTARRKPSLFALAWPIFVEQSLHVLVYSLRATGDARFPLIIGILSMWGLWVPLSGLLGLQVGLGLPGIWLAMTADEWLRGMVFFRRWHKRSWLPHAQRSHSQACSHRCSGGSTPRNGVSK